MDYKQFKKILEHDETEKKESIEVLLQFVNEFPYFQTAQSLLAKAMHEQQHVRYERQLKLAAAYSADRKSLYDLIHPKRVNLFNNKKESVSIHVKEVENDIEKNIFVAPQENLIPPSEERVEEFIPEIHSGPKAEESLIEEVKVEENSFSENTSADISAPKVDYEKLSYSPVSMFDDGTLEGEPDDYYDETPVADPHEIIRRRLNEILGFKEEKEKKPEVIQADEKKKNDIPVPENKFESDLKTEINIPGENSETITENKIKSESEIKTLNDKTGIIEESVIEHIEEKEGANISEAKNEDAIDRLSQQSRKAVDAIDLGELEYALEASLIQSLEKLPLIEKQEQEIQTPSVEIEVDESTKSHTFFEWLKIKSEGGYGKVEVVHADEPDPEIEKTAPSDERHAHRVDDSKRTEDIISRFIASDPKIVPSKAEFYSPANQAKKSITEDDDLVSETLANIYRQQGHHHKARSAYQKLSLLYPEKLAFFAALILELDKEISRQGLS